MIVWGPAVSPPKPSESGGCRGVCKLYLRVPIQRFRSSPGGRRSGDPRGRSPPSSWCVPKRSRQALITNRPDTGRISLMNDVPGLPPGVTRRQFIEDVLDVMGDAQVIYEAGPDGRPVIMVRRSDLLTALAAEMGPPPPKERGVRPTAARATNPTTTRATRPRNKPATRLQHGLRQAASQ